MIESKEPTPMEAALDSLDQRGVTIRYNAGTKTLSLYPHKKVTHPMIESLKPYKPLLLRAYADPLVQKVLHAVDGRIADVFEKGSDEP